MYLRNRTPTSANKGRMPYQLFYDMIPDVSHIRTFGFIVRVALPAEKLGKLDERAALGYLLRVRWCIPGLDPKDGCQGDLGCHIL